MNSISEENTRGIEFGEEEEGLPSHAIVASSMVEEFFRSAIYALNCQHLSHLLPEFEQAYEMVIARVPKRTKYRTFSRLVPPLLYMFLKLKGVVVNNNQYRTIFKQNYRAFATQVKEVIPFYSEFQRRDKTHLIQEYIRYFMAQITHTQSHYFIALSIYNYIYPFLQFTKEETICSVVCTLTTLILEDLEVSITEVCRLIGVSAGAIECAIVSKLYPPLGITISLGSSKGLCTLAPIIRERILKQIVPASGDTTFYQDHLISQYEVAYVQKALRMGRSLASITAFINRTHYEMRKILACNLNRV